MKTEDLNWVLNQARLSELRIFRDKFWDLCMSEGPQGPPKQDLIDSTFEMFRARVSELEEKL